MIHIALLVAYTLFLAWLGINVLLLIVLGVVVLFRRPSGWAAEEVQRDPRQSRGIFVDRRTNCS